MEYLRRFYREKMKAPDLVPFRVVMKESDLFIWAGKHLAEEAAASLAVHRGRLESFIGLNPLFAETHRPFPVPGNAPEVVKRMGAAAEKVGVGPMAAVAGALAEVVGEDLLAFTGEVIVENGGDIFLHSSRERRVGVFAGESPLSGKLVLVLGPTTPTGKGLCTSSATVGPSYSAGRADSAVVLAESAALADAAATALGNRARDPSGITEALEWIMEVEGVEGALVVMGEKMGVAGGLRLEKGPGI